MSETVRVNDARIPAVILAGSRTTKPFFPGDAPGYKALLPLLGRPLIEWTLDAVEGAAGVSDLLVVAPDEVGRALGEHLRVTLVPDRGGFIENVLAGLKAADSERLLFVNCDVPLATPAMIDRFLALAPAAPDVVVSAAEAGSLHSLPLRPRKPFQPLADGRYAHGNVFLVNHRDRDTTRLRAAVNRMYARRKLALASATALGLRFLCWFLWKCLITHQATLAELVRHASAIIGVSAAAVIVPYAELALDIDEPKDYAFAEALLRLRGHDGTAPRDGENAIGEERGDNDHVLLAEADEISGTPASPPGD